MHVLDYVDLEHPIVQKPIQQNDVGKVGILANSNLKQELEIRLRKIYDDDEFVRCVFIVAGNDENYRKMLAFIDKAESLGDDVTHDDIVALSVVLSNEQII